MSKSETPSQSTPMLRQYYEIKKQYPGTILFFRMGDFYELFFDDAILGAREMEITLTARHKEKGNPIPMCGVPYHSATGYIAKLVRKGFRVAICEQTEDPKSTTKLVKREVVRVVTPGTALEAQLLESKQNSYLASVCGSDAGLGLALIDLSTGEFLATQFTGDDAREKIQEQLDIFAPREILHPHSLAPLFHRGASPSPSSGESEPSGTLSDARPLIGEEITRTPLEDWLFGVEHAESLLRAQLGTESLDGYGMAGKSYAISAAGAALYYVNETQKAQASHVSGVSYFELNDFLVLDGTTVSNLELVASTEGKGGRTVFSILDETMTGMGARLLRQWLLRPLLRREEIEGRLDAVEELKGSAIRRDQVRRLLEPMADLERLSGKVTLGRANARDLIALRVSIEAIPSLRRTVENSRSGLLQYLGENLDELEDVKLLIAESIADEPPAAVNEPGMIRDGYNAELDELRNLAHSGKSYIAAIEARERGRTGIASLKVKFNNVFGYFIEISNANRDKVPADYERKQTLVNSERYTTPELKEYETKVLGAEERILEIEMALFVELRRRIALEVRRIQGVARAVATLDALCSLSGAHTTTSNTSLNAARSA